MLFLPHRPQLLEIVPKRFVEFSFSFTPAVSSTLTLLSPLTEMLAI